MELRELCRRLKPALGRRADQYWLAYLAEDARGRAEIEMVIRLQAARLLGSDVNQPDAHLSAPPRNLASGKYAIGDVIYADRPQHPFGIREDELIQHVAVFGRSGAGKTNTIMQFLSTLLENEKHFLIFDWKRNYRDLLGSNPKDLLVYTVGRAEVPFTFNPLIPPAGTDPRTWLKKIIEIIAHAYYLGEGVMYMLQEAIHAVYEAHAVYHGSPEAYPTLLDVAQWLEEHPVKGRKALWMDSTMRGIKSMCFGHMGNVVNTAVQPHLEVLLEHNVILELDSLSNADKTLITEALLLWIHHYRMAQGERETFKHAILIEEAHHILRKQAGGGAEAITETILREIRELGEAVIIVDQHPSMISIPALGNTYTTITMNLKHRSDVSAVAAAMLLDDGEQELLGRLPVGSAIVKLQGRWPTPFEVRIPHKKIVKGAVDDAMLVRHMQERDPLRAHARRAAVEILPSQTVESPALSSAQLSATEEAFLLDIAAHPFSGVVQRYRRLETNRRKGNAWKEQCLERELIAAVDIPTREGRVVLLQLTDQGRAVLEALGHQAPPPSRWGGLEHEYWKDRVRTHFEEMEFAVTEEAPVNGFTDLVVETPAGPLGVEIETGKSDWRKNLEKNLRKGFARVLIVATTPEFCQALRFEEAVREMPTVAVITAQELVELRQPALFDALWRRQDGNGVISGIPG